MEFRVEMRDAIRSIAARPAYALVSILTLGIGIGASLSIFALAESLVVQPPAGIAAPEQLVRVIPTDRARGGSSVMSYPAYAELRDHVASFSSLATHLPGSLDAAVQGVDPRVVRSDFVSGNYFTTLGARVAGRAITLDDVSRDLSVVVVSARFGRSIGANEVQALGRQVALNGRPFTIVGVALGEFHGTDIPAKTDVWLPISAFYPLVTGKSARTLENRGTASLDELIGRLAPETSIERAQVQIDSVTAHFAGWQGSIDALQANTVRLTVYPGVGLRPTTRTHAIDALRLLGGAVALLLVLACINVAAMWRARAVERQREVAVRRALGAGTWSIVRQHMIEFVLVALAGGAGGLGICLIAGRLTATLHIAGLPSLEPLAMNWRVFGAAFGASVASGVIAGVLPAMFAARRDPFPDLKAPAGAYRTRTGYALAATQLALSLTLVIGAALLIRTTQSMLSVPLGFDPHGLVIASVSPTSHGYAEERRISFYRALLERLRGAGSLDAAALSYTAPFVGFGSEVRVFKSTDLQAPSIAVSSNQVTSDYFVALGVPVVAGRTFTRAEEFSGGGPGALVVSRTLAGRLFGSEMAAVGQSITIGRSPAEPIVGVVGDIRGGDLKGGFEPAVYAPLGQSPFAMPSFVFIHARSARHWIETAAAIQHEVSALDPALPIANAISGTAAVEESIDEETTMAQLFGAFAILALSLAAVGLYGVLTQTVASRTREFGVRAALGATRLRVMISVLSNAVAVAACGVVVGLVSAMALTRILASRLFGVGPFDPPTFALASALLVAVAVLASIVPARRAGRVDPIVALRSE